MWSDLVDIFNNLKTTLGGWITEGEKLIYLSIPLAALVYLIVTQLMKATRNRRPSQEDRRDPDRN